MSQDPSGNTPIYAVEMEKISFVNTLSKEADFLVKAKAAYLKTSASCYIAFDRPANTDDFLLEANDRVVRFEPCEFTKISALGVSGSGTLYITATR